MHSIGASEQSQPQPPPLQVAYPFMQELIQMMKIMGQKQIESTLDKNYERIRKQSAKVFTGTTDPMVAEEWLRNTERVLDNLNVLLKREFKFS